MSEFTKQILNEIQHLIEPDVLEKVKALPLTDPYDCFDENDAYNFALKYAGRVYVNYFKEKDFSYTGDAYYHAALALPAILHVKHHDAYRSAVETNCLSWSTMRFYHVNYSKPKINVIRLFVWYVLRKTKFTLWHLFKRKRE